MQCAPRCIYHRGKLAPRAIKHRARRFIAGFGGFFDPLRQRRYAAALLPPIVEDQIGQIQIHAQPELFHQ